HRYARLDDPGLLHGHRLDGAAEILLVIEVDRRDHRNQRLDHIGCVEAAAEADLDHGDIDSTASKMQERHYRDEFEKGQVDPLARRRCADLVREVDDFRLGNEGRTDSYSLRERHEM